MDTTQSQFNNLPPPPTGQQGMTLDQFQHLPPPPKGQTGMTLEQIKSQTPEGKLQTEDTGYVSGLGARTGAEELAGVKKIGSSIQMGSQDLRKGINQVKQGGAGNVLKGIGKGAQGLAEGAFGTISGVARTALAPATAVLSPVVKATAPVAIPAVVSYLRMNNPVAGDIYDKLAPEVQQKLAPQLQQISQQHPNATALTGDILNTVLLAFGGGEAEAPVKEALGSALSKDSLKAIPGELKSVPSGIKNAVMGSPEANATRRAAANAQKISEMISPDATAKEAKLAQAQGRLYSGKSSTLFKAGTADKIATSPKTFNATQTILKKIPGAGKMAPSDLYNAVEENIGETATKLRPQMEATSIKPQTVEKINSDWQTLKKQQIEDVPATEEANVMKRQGKFESILKKSSSGHFGDLWDTRISYDNSIPASVKKANINSPESLQIQKEEWLQNRAILNDAINNSASGLGGKSQQAFSEMSDLYEAKNNLLAKTKLEGGQPSKVRQLINKYPKTSAGIGLTVAGETGRKLITGSF